MVPEPRGTAGPDQLVAGRYRLVSSVGRGAMGAVWLARDELLRRDVALKQVFSQAGLSADEAAAQRAAVLREGRAAARLSHPHAVAVHDVAVDSGEAWLVMAHFPSRSLGAQLVRRGVLESPDAARIGAEVADALAAAHDAGVVHSDVKPGNVLLGEAPGQRDEVRLTDFGIARMLSEAAGSAEDDIVGTPVYFSPEVARGQDPTPASDVFSLGATLWTLVEGAPPFGGDEDTTALLRRIATTDAPEPPHGGAMTPVVLAMLARDPAQRPTMREARDRLAAVAASPRDGRAVPAPRPAPAAPGSASPGGAAPGLIGADEDDDGWDDAAGRRSRLLTVVAALLVLVLLGTVVLVVLASL